MHALRQIFRKRRKTIRAAGNQHRAVDFAQTASSKDLSTGVSHATVDTLHSPGLPNRNRYIPYLPVELWMLILSFVNSDDDMISLSHVSNILRILVLSSFGTIHLPTPQNAPIPASRRLASYRILVSMQDTQRATIVTSLYVTLPCMLGGDASTTHSQRCMKLDLALGKALHCMINLETLHIHCQLCLVYERHRYLAYLVAPKLRDLSVICGCNTAPALKYANMNEFPIFDNVEALRWSIYGILPAPVRHNPAKFTKLEALEYHGGQAEGSLLAMHPIRRLLVDATTSQYDSLFTRALEGSPGVLTHLIFQYSPRITEIVPQFSSYLGRLQHVGTLPDFKAPNTAVPLQSYLDTLASLPCLVSLDAVSGRTRWDHDTIALVNKSLRSLQRVMVHRAQCYVWELQRGIWKKRNVASFSTWDIIRGACN